METLFLLHPSPAIAAYSLVSTATVRLSLGDRRESEAVGTDVELMWAPVRKAEMRHTHHTGNRPPLTGLKTGGPQSEPVFITSSSAWPMFSFFNEFAFNIYTYSLLYFEVRAGITTETLVGKDSKPTGLFSSN